MVSQLLTEPFRFSFFSSADEPADFDRDTAAVTLDCIRSLRGFAEAQMGVYENASGAPDSGSAGWFFCQFTGRSQTGRRWRINRSARRSELTD